VIREFVAGDFVIRDWLIRWHIFMILRANNLK